MEQYGWNRTHLYSRMPIFTSLRHRLRPHPLLRTNYRMKSCEFMSLSEETESFRGSLTRISRKPKFGVRVGHSKQARFDQHIFLIRCGILIFLAVPRSLQRGVRKVIECLATGLTTVTLTFNLSSACSYSVLSKSNNRMVFAMRANKSIFMLLLLNFINRSNWKCHSLGSGMQKVDKFSLTIIVQCISKLFQFL